MRLVILLTTLVCLSLAAQHKLTNVEKLQLDPYPFTSVIQSVQATLSTLPNPAPTNLTKKSYLETITPIIKFFRQYQDTSGKIIDPYAKIEIQYATPTYSHAATMLALSTNDAGLMQSAILAFQHSLGELVNGTCAQGHSNFYVLPLMYAYEAYVQNKVVDVTVIDAWNAMWKKVNTSTYQTSGNWGLVATAGEFIRYLHGFTTLAPWVEHQLSFQLPLFSSAGMYPDPNTPMPYDIFPRHYLDIMIQRGYNGTYLSTMQDLLQRGALTSLMMQSPWGELPVGGRSSQHQWNEAVQTVVFELYASRMKASGNMVLAKAFKRAARLAHSSLRRWYQPQGDLYIVKNHFDPSLRFGYEGYSYLSQYNLLPCSMLMYASLYADDTIDEGPSFSENGGFAIYVPVHHKIFSNVAGFYIEIETAADPEYDSTGLSRIHNIGVEPLVGPTAAVPNGQHPLCVGVSWSKNGKKESLAQVQRNQLYVNMTNVQMGENSVKFTVNYTITGYQVPYVTETYTVSKGTVNVSASVPVTVDKLSVIFPVFVFDGKTNTSISVVGQNGGTSVCVRMGNSQQQFNVPAALSYSYIPSAQYPFRNGYMSQAEVFVDPKSNSVSYSSVLSVLS